MLIVYINIEKLYLMQLKRINFGLLIPPILHLINKI